jgi:hypothetical protein
MTAELLRDRGLRQSALYASSWNGVVVLCTELGFCVAIRVIPLVDQWEVHDGEYSQFGRKLQPTLWLVVKYPHGFVCSTFFLRELR